MRDLQRFSAIDWNVAIQFCAAPAPYPASFRAERFPLPSETARGIEAVCEVSS
jgi:hypothetical protein